MSLLSTAQLLTMHISVEVISDLICPWCFLGKRRLEKAISKIQAVRPDIEFAVHWRPYMLNPELPARGVAKQQSYLKRFRGNQDRLDAMNREMTGLFQAEGLNFAKDGIIGNTFDGHCLAEHLLQEHGLKVQDHFVDIMFQEYHEHGNNPASRAVLLEAVQRVGGDRERAGQILDGNDDFRALVRSHINKNKSGGTSDEMITGVPHFIIATPTRRLEVPGAQDPDTLERIILRLVERSAADAPSSL